MPASSRDDAPSGVSRRSFLKVSALGAGASALGTGAVALPMAACTPSPPDPPDGPSGGRWVEPAVWDVSVHGDTPLQLTVSEVVAPAWLSDGGQGPETLFAYNGSVPGPTIRMRGDSVLRVQLVNALSGNDGNWAHLNNTRFAFNTEISGEGGGSFAANGLVPDLPDWRLSRNLMYGPHMQHTINLHTHGLHVRPGLNDGRGSNPNGTHSDNVMLRVIPYSDAEKRAAHTPPIPLTEHEVVGQASYEFRLGASSDTPTHPPGTHWYHPHPHGATYDQVASGQAGFLIVEGDVDDALAEALSDRAYDYRERVVLMQRVFDTGNAPIQDGEKSGDNRLQKNQDTVQTVNGQPAGTLGFTMRAGAVERWRVLNGSVDGKGYIQVVLAPKGDLPPDAQDFTNQTPEAYVEALYAWIDAHGRPMWHMAFDGVTLVSEDGRYTADRTRTVQLAPANRSDFVYQAPQDAGEYVLWGASIGHRAGGGFPPPATALATITVAARDDAPAPLADRAIADVLGAVPLPEYLAPITEAELRGADGIRTRQVVYSGWGNGGYTCAPNGTPLQESGKNSMAISRMKYDPNRPVQKMGLGTAEEWVLNNYSVGKPPLSTISPGTNAVDHPFHMHQNPFWVMAILVPTWAEGAPLDAEPTYENILPRPRWQDVVPIPADGGRVVFRSRFPDYYGFYVNHCHLLQHEDWGMMQAVEVMQNRADANPLFHAAPYDLQDPNNTTGSFPKPTLQTLIDHCREIHDLDGTIGPGGVVSGGTTVTFCEPSS